MPLRLDSVAGGVNTGHKVSAVYFIGRTGGNDNDDDYAIANKAATLQQNPLVSGSSSSAGGQLVLQNMEAAGAAAPVADGEIRSPRTTDSSSSGSSTGLPPTGQRPQGVERDGVSEEANTVNRSEDDHEAMDLTRPLDSPGGRATEEESAPPGQQRSAVVEPTADRLVLFQSDRVSTQTLEVLGRGREQYAVLFWMHAAKGEVGDLGSDATADAAVEGK